MRRNQSVLLIVIVLSVSSCWYASDVLHDVRSRSWQETSAEVLDVEHLNRPLRRRWERDKVNVRYAYSVEGRRYESSMEIKRTDLSHRYPDAGDTITIFYNRGNPAESSLTRGLRVTSMIVLFAVAVVTLGFFLRTCLLGMTRQ